MPRGCSGQRRRETRSKFSPSFLSPPSYEIVFDAIQFGGSQATFTGHKKDANLFESHSSRTKDRSLRVGWLLVAVVLECEHFSFKLCELALISVSITFDQRKTGSVESYSGLTSNSSFGYSWLDFKSSLSLELHPLLVPAPVRVHVLWWTWVTQSFTPLTHHFDRVRLTLSKATNTDPTHTSHTHHTHLHPSCLCTLLSRTSRSTRWPTYVYLSTSRLTWVATPQHLPMAHPTEGHVSVSFL